MNISLDVEIAFDKNQHTFMIKALNEPGIKENLLILIKSIHKKQQVTSYLIVSD